MDKKSRAHLHHGWAPRRRRKPLRLALLMLGTCLTLGFIWSTFIVLDARERTPRVLQRTLASQAMPLKLQDVPPRYLELLLAVQDPAFYDHHGVKLLPRPGRMMTVTQVLVEYLYLERFQPGVLNEIRQALIAMFALDAMTTKEQQLALFINIAHLGRMNGWPVRGFDQAAQMYYGRNLAQLSENEFLSLVAMLDAPATFNVARYPEANARRVTQIRADLEKQGS